MYIFVVVVQASFVAKFPMTFRTLESSDVAMNDLRMTNQVFFEAKAIATHLTSE